MEICSKKKEDAMTQNEANSIMNEQLTACETNIAMKYSKNMFIWDRLKKNILQT